MEDIIYVFFLLLVFASALIPPAFGQITSINCTAACTKGHPNYDDKLDRRASKTIEYMIDNAATISQKPGCFYSGQTNVKGKPVNMYTRMNEFQAKIGQNCTVVSDLVTAAGQTAWDPEWPVCPDWARMSEQFAKTVKGTVYVLLGKEVCDTSSWRVSEHPILKNNPAVTKIEIFELDTTQEIVPKQHHDTMMNTTSILFRPDPSFPSISFKFPVQIISFARIAQQIPPSIQLLLFNTFRTG